MYSNSNINDKVSEPNVITNIVIEYKIWFPFTVGRKHFLWFNTQFIP